jgi:hypothetical protein
VDITTLNFCSRGALKKRLARPPITVMKRSSFVQEGFPS